MLLNVLICKTGLKANDYYLIFNWKPISLVFNLAVIYENIFAKEF